MKDFNWIQFTATLGTILVGMVSLYFSYRMNKKILLKKGQEDEQKEIYKKLNEFYGPLSLLRGKSKRMYEIFSQRFKVSNPDFRTLNFLIEKGKTELEGDELTLLEGIIKVGEKIENLVIEKSGLIDDQELNEQLKRLITHTSILRLAFDGLLTSKPDSYNDNTFPRHLDENIEAKIVQLKKKLDELKKV